MQNRNEMKILMINILSLLMSLFSGEQQAHGSDTVTDSFETHRLVLSNQDTIAYIDEGEGEQTLLFIHGLGGHSKHWKQNVKELRKNYRCIAIDLPCYGESSKVVRKVETDYMSYFSEVVLGVIQQLDVQQVTLVGHSMGGQIAMITALKAPQTVQQLVLISPAGIETFTPAEAIGMKQFTPPAFFKNQNEQMIRAALKRNFYSPPSNLEAMVKQRMKLKESKGFDAYCQTVSNSIKGMLDHPVFDKLTEIQQKTLIIYGENDALIPNRMLHPKLSIQQVAQTAKEQIPHATLFMLPKAGHLLQLEKCTETNELIHNFLKK